MEETEAANERAGRCGRPQRSGIPEMPRKVGYLSVFVAGDSMGIDRQRDLVQRATLLEEGFGYVVDVGWTDGDASCPPALFDVLRAARVRAVDVVAVEGIGRFARERAAAVRIAAILCDAGVQIRELSRDGKRSVDPRRSSGHPPTGVRRRSKAGAAADGRNRD